MKVVYVTIFGDAHMYVTYSGVNQKYLGLSDCVWIVPGTVSLDD